MSQVPRSGDGGRSAGSQGTGEPTAPAGLAAPTAIPDGPDLAATSPERLVPGGGPSRRRWMLTLAGALAMAGGFAAWWRMGRTDGPVADAATRDLWALSFSTPEGGSLALKSLAGRPLLINFWATWCPPCVEELPLLDAFYRENQRTGWQVLGIAADSASAVQAFRSRMPLSFPLVLAGMAGIELSRSLGNLSGALPFSVLLAKSGAVVQRKMGKLRPEDLAAWRQAL